MSKFVIIALVAIASVSPALAEQGDAARGQQDFRACAPEEITKMIEARC